MQCRLHRWRWATGRYASGAPSRRPERRSRPTRTASIASAPSRSASSVRRGVQPTATHSYPTTCASPTPYPADDRPARRSRDPPPDVRRPPAGRRDRAPRVPDAVVAGDVRARAVQARRASAWRRSRTRTMVGYLICSRYDTVWHLMNVSVDPSRRRQGIATALLTSLIERIDDPQSQLTLEVRPSNGGAIRALRALRLPLRRRAAALLPGQRRGRADHVAHARDAAGDARRRPGHARRRVLILALETSCDDTCAAVRDARRARCSPT